MSVFAKPSFKGTVSLWTAPVDSDETNDIMSVSVADDKIRINSNGNTFTGNIESAETTDDSIVYTTTACTDANGKLFDPYPYSLSAWNYKDVENPRYHIFIPKGLANGEPYGHFGVYFTFEDTNDGDKQDTDTRLMLIRVDSDDTLIQQIAYGSFDAETAQQMDPASNSYAKDLSKLEDKFNAGESNLSTVKGKLSEASEGQWRFSIPDSQKDAGISYEADED